MIEAGRVKGAAGWIVPTAVLVVSSRYAARHRVGRCEERVFRLVNNGPDRLHAPVWVVMQSGSLAAVFGAAAVLRRRDPATAARAVVAGVAAWSLAKSVKQIVGRGRPADHLDGVRVRGAPQTGSGFPSGHAAVVTTLALLATSPHSMHRAGAATTAISTGIARMYVGAHLPLDVVSGLAIGLAVGRASTSAAGSPVAASTGCRCGAGG